MVWGKVNGVKKLLTSKGERLWKTFGIGVWEGVVQSMKCEKR